MKLIFALVFIVGVYCSFVSTCVSTCNAYGSTINNVYPYSNYKFFYIPKDTENGCKQCYFSVSSRNSNSYNFGIYNKNFSVVISSDLSSDGGFTTCISGYCTLSFVALGVFDSFSIQMIENVGINSLDKCIYNNTHCNDIVPMSIDYSNKILSYNQLSCTFR